MTRGLLDTSTFLLLERVDVERLPTRIVLSVITLAELAVGVEIAVSPTDRALRRQHLDDARDCEILPFDLRCAGAFGLLAAALRRRESKRRVRSFDALIAASAIAHDITLYSANVSDFADLPGLRFQPTPALD